MLPGPRVLKLLCMLLEFSDGVRKAAVENDLEPPTIESLLRRTDDLAAVLEGDLPEGFKPWGDLIRRKIREDS